MKSVEDYMEEDRIKKVERDVGKLKGLLERSKKRLEDVKERNVSDKNAFLILENSYESIRESIESLMALKGFKSEDHVATISWAAEEMELEKSETNKLHKYRKLRNASRYEAEEVTKEEAKEIIKFGTKFIKKMEKKIETGKN